VSDAWDPQQYGRFAAERRQPFDDLCRLVEPLHGGAALDLGCGSGELTVALPALVGAGRVVGRDTSAAMLAQAEQHAARGVTFEPGDLREPPEPGRWDLVLANASLHWAPEHGTVLARWRDGLRAGGQLAVQVPANADHPSHQVAAQVATREPFASAFPGGAPADVVAANVLRPEAYAVLLHDLGAQRQHVRLQVYGHVLGRTADIVEWVKGTSLTRFKQTMPADLYDRFVAEYQAELVATLGDRSPFFYPFKRILFWARF